MATTPQEDQCASCQAILAGPYCHQCGERQHSADELTVKALFQQFVASVFNVDNKFLRTIRSLFSRPGQLTVEYVEGRRTRYMRPFQMFVLVNVIFFLVLTDADLFRAPAKWYFPNPVVQSRVDDLIAKSGWTMEELTIRYDQASSDWAKGLIVLMIPVVGLVLGLFLWGRPAGLHIVYATHFLTFFLAYLPLMALILIPFLPVHRFVLQGLILLGMGYYHANALPRVYGVRGWWRVVLTVLLTVSVIVLMIGYRTAISAFSLWQLA